MLKCRILCPLFLTALSLVFACEGKDSTSELAIYGGRPVPEKTRMDAVALTDSEGVFCSATAVSPSLVLTAAHCLDGKSAEAIRVYVGTGEAGGAQIGQYAVKKMAIHPLYDLKDQDKGYDSGYLLLESPIDLPLSDFTPILTDPLEMKELFRGGVDSYLVGFGWNKKNVLGLKFETKAKVRKFYKVEILLGGQGRDACQGDSGGPAYGLLKTGEWRVYGITSRGSDCGQGGFWGIMSANICWAMEDSGATDRNLPSAYCAQASGTTAQNVEDKQDR